MHPVVYFHGLQIRMNLMHKNVNVMAYLRVPYPITETLLSVRLSFLVLYLYMSVFFAKKDFSFLVLTYQNKNRPYTDSRYAALTWKQTQRFTLSRTTRDICTSTLSTNPESRYEEFRSNSVLYSHDHLPGRKIHSLWSRHISIILPQSICIY